MRISDWSSDVCSSDLLIGVAFALPLLWFAWKRAIPKGYGWRLTALFALGGLQGAIGWWMVASGLIDRPDVSHLRLATHLRSEEHTSELQSLMRISYAVFCLKKKNNKNKKKRTSTIKH